MSFVEETVKQFITNLRQSDWAACQQVVERCLNSELPSNVAQGRYFSGILANERDKNWGAAEKIFDDLYHDLPANSELRVKVSMALGRTYDYQGKWKLAIKTYQTCISLFQQAADRLNEARNLQLIAISSCKGFDNGDLPATVLGEAVDRCEHALQLIQALEEKQADDQSLAILKGRVFGELGILKSRQKEWSLALSYLQKDIDISLMLKHEYDLMFAYNNIGEIYYQMGDAYWPLAADCYKKALDLTREYNEPLQEFDTLANFGLLYHKQGKLAFALASYEAAIALVERVRANLDTPNARSNFFSTISTLYAHLVILCIEVEDYERAFLYAERARARGLLDMLAEKNTKQLIDAAEPISLGKVQSRLPQDALLLFFFTTGQINGRARDKHIQRHRFPEDKIFVFAVTKSEVSVSESRISPNHLQPSDNKNIVERNFLDSNMRNALFKELLQPFKNHLNLASNLFLIPHGILHYIPFHALVGTDSQTVLQPNGPVFTYGLSASSLFRHMTQNWDNKQSAGLTIGYNSQGVNQLASAEDEARAVAELIGGNCLIAPQKSRLLSQMANQKFIHIACHGAFTPDAPLDSKLHLNPNEFLTPLDIIDGVRLNSELVILSACESGLSRVYRGDELQGFVRAFIYAGTPVLITTLWRVYDHITRLLMGRFYKLYLDGADAAQALHEAQLYIKQMTRSEALLHLNKNRGAQASVAPTISLDEHPFADPLYWAAYIVIGHRWNS